MASKLRTAAADPLIDAFLDTRRQSEQLAAPLSDADATLQAHPDASPAKWHLAHTTWFFETFVLRDHAPGYRLHDADWPFLFNSYYDGEGARHARHKRGLISRPSLDEILRYRHHVDAAMAAALPDLPADIRDLVTLGIAHEQQHQELLLTDILAALAENPLAPAYQAVEKHEIGPKKAENNPDSAWIEGRSGLVEVGAPANGFAFDAERPRHAVWLHPHAIASRPVTNAEWIAFIDDDGYRDSRLWLSDGWAWVSREAVEAPLYWRRDGEWKAFGLNGLRPCDPAASVTHISFYEADAYARWAGARLPTEFEWEAAALTKTSATTRATSPGGVWEWTASAFLPYPGFAPAPGTVGEYNGKFMSGQMVLRGGSFATPRGHLRASYRNFFPPHARWQFSGVRLARDV